MAVKASGLTVPLGMVLAGTGSVKRVRTAVNFVSLSEGLQPGVSRSQVGVTLFVP